MTVFLSSLVRGMDQLEEVARWVNGLHDPGVGVELIAFTHDQGYWDRLCALLEEVTCPVSFHGPYIKTEGTSAPGTPAYAFLEESYRRTFGLAKAHGVRHVVYHTTQLGWKAEEVDEKRKQADENACFLDRLAAEQGVQLLVENLAYPMNPELRPLYTNEEYNGFFERFPQMNSIIDVGHAHVNKLDLASFLASHGDRVKAYHFHNNDGARDQHNHIFDGTFSYEGFAPLFRQYTPEAAIVLEYEPHVNLSWAELEEQLRWVSEHFG